MSLTLPSGPRSGTTLVCQIRHVGAPGKPPIFGWTEEQQDYVKKLIICAGAEVGSDWNGRGSDSWSVSIRYNKDEAWKLNAEYHRLCTFYSLGKWPDKVREKCVSDPVLALPPVPDLGQVYRLLHRDRELNEAIEALDARRKSLLEEWDGVTSKLRDLKVADDPKEQIKILERT